MTLRLKLLKPMQSISNYPNKQWISIYIMPHSLSFFFVVFIYYSFIYLLIFVVLVFFNFNVRLCYNHIFFVTLLYLKIVSLTLQSHILCDIGVS